MKNKRMIDFVNLILETTDNQDFGENTGYDFYIEDINEATHFHNLVLWYRVFNSDSHTVEINGVNYKPTGKRVSGKINSLLKETEDAMYFYQDKKNKDNQFEFFLEGFVKLLITACKSFINFSSQPAEEIDVKVDGKKYYLRSNSGNKNVK